MSHNEKVKDNLTEALKLRTELISKIDEINKIPKYKRSESELKKLKELHAKRIQVEEIILELARKEKVA